MSVSVCYSMRGFPVPVSESLAKDSVFVSPEVQEIQERDIGDVNHTFDKQLNGILQILEIYKAAGRVFKLVHHERPQISINAFSFLDETVSILVGHRTRRLIGWGDLTLILTGEQSYKRPDISQEQAKRWNEVASLSDEHLIQRWITVLGVDDLFRSFGIMYGPLAANDLA